MTASQLQELLCQRYGWQLEAHGPDAVGRAVKQRMLWLEIDQEAHYLDSLDPDSPEFLALLEEVIVPESWFFREREALFQLLPWAQARYTKSPEHPLRILSAPCSRGEEPVSIAIQLLDGGMPEGSFVIDAIDISAIALEQARKGLYTNFSFRGDDLGFRDQAFDALPGGWRVKERYRSPITYQSYNILELPHFFKGYDVIFCRNLLIYLTDSARNLLFQKFHRMLHPEGRLFLAASEFALPPQSHYQAQNWNGALIFGKAPPPYLADSTWAKPKPKPPLLPNLNPKPPLSRPSHPPNLQRRPQPLLPQDPKVPPVAPRQNDRHLTNSTQLAELLENAERSANQGRFEEASGLCKEALLRGPSSRAYYLLALVDSAQNRNDEAESNLRRALYLEPDNKEALAQLALCREKSGDQEGSRRLRERMKR